MAEGGGLLNRYTVISRIVGSNPIPSATLLIKLEKLGFYRRWNARYVTGDFTRLPPDCHRGVLELFSAQSASTPASALSTTAAARSSVFPKR